MSSNFVKRHNAIGWDWYLVTNEASSWVSHMVKEHIEQVEAENDRLRELVRQMHTCLTRPKAYAGTSQPYLIATECPYFTQGVCDYNSCGFEQRMSDLGIEVSG